MSAIEPEQEAVTGEAEEVLATEGLVEGEGIVSGTEMSPVGAATEMPSAVAPRDTTDHRPVPAATGAPRACNLEVGVEVAEEAVEAEAEVVVGGAGSRHGGWKKIMGAQI